MTNGEQFKKIFGIPFEDMSIDMLRQPYRKLQKYEYELYDYSPCHLELRKTIALGNVWARSKTEARREAILRLGSNYSRWVGSGKPMYGLRIEKATEQGEE